MITLAMDTAYKHLVLGLYEEDRLLAGCEIEALKKQSEMIFVELNALLKETGLTYKDINQVVITDGPGSYTGIRIAMTVAKVLCTRMHIPLYVISTMQLYAGAEPEASVILDARGHRVYAARLHHGRIEGQEEILDLSNVPAWLDAGECPVFGDAYLVERKGKESSFLKNFMDLKALWRPVENIHALVPRYLKESDAYKQ